MTDRTMGPVDTIWLNMDTPENLMVIDSLMVLDGPADWDRVSELFQKRLVEAYPSFRQRVKRPRAGIGSPHWNHDPNFLLSKHLIRHTLPDGEDSTLQRYIEEQMQIPLRQTRPLWQAHLIDGYHKGSVIYSRIHHCIADGIALVTWDMPDRSMNVFTEEVMDELEKIIGAVAGDKANITAEAHLGAARQPVGLQPRNAVVDAVDHAAGGVAAADTPYFSV